MTTPPPTTRRVYSPGHGLPDISSTQIEAEAKAAADEGHSLGYACPYPFHTPAGHHFVGAYYLNRRAAPRTAQVLARSAFAL